MRFTLEPLGDLVVPDGLTLAAARGGLVALTGVTALHRAPLSAEGHLLAEDQVAGLAPWVEGSRVVLGEPRRSTTSRTRSTAPDAPAPRFFAVLTDGPDAGRCVPLRGRFAPGADLGPGLGRWVRAGGLWWWAPPGRPPCPVRRVRAGQHVVEPARRASGRTPVPPPPGPAWAWLVPATGALVAAVVWRTPVLALLALGGLAPLVGRLGRARQVPWAPGPADCSARLAADDRSPPGWLDAAREGLALVGPRPAVLGVARTLLGSALTDPELGVALDAVGGRSADWAWLRWLGSRVAVSSTAGTDPAPARGAARLMVADGTGLAALQRWWSAREGAGLLLLSEHPHQVPAWCRHVIRVQGDHRTRASSPAWAEAHARALAARDESGRGGLPRVVGLADLPTAGPGAWAVPIGTGESGTAWVDLVSDGPHVLVAGTTGAGKSELLQTLVLALARRHGPDRLALVLVDFKGGAGLGACRGLPHVVGTVTDLDPAATSRALVGLRAELRHRETLLGAAGVADLEALRARGPAPPRLVVVVDELLALRDELPDALPALVRLATQGRALGIHLVLATQRPAGALDAQVRANVALRICLRVADPADSLDVLGTDEAAALPVDVPGRALIRRGESSPVAVQTAWAALAPADRRPGWAPSWPPERPRALRVDHVAELVADLSATGQPSRPLWRPPLPASVHLDQVPHLVGTVHGAQAGPGPDGAGAATAHRWDTPTPTGERGLLVGLVDSPEQRRTDPLRWRPHGGLLGIAGGPGSGRTTTLRTLTQAAWADGRTVHVLHGGDWVWPPGPDALRGTEVGADDPRRAWRLLSLLEPGRGRDVLLVDDLATLRACTELLPRGAAADLAGVLARMRLPVACAGSSRDLRGLAVQQLMLPGAEADTGVLGPGPPGRGRFAGATCQVALPAVRARSAVAGDAAVGGGMHVAPSTAGTPLRLLALPERCSVPPQPARAPWTATLGVGGDDAGPVEVDLRRGLLVVGPAGSGRSTVLDVLAAHPPPGTRVLRPDPADLAAVGRSGGGADPTLLVLDDADLALRRAPDLDETLSGWLHAAERGSGPVPRLVLSARTDRAAAAFRGVLAALREGAPVLVLDPMTSGSNEAAGADLSCACDPRRVPGRAVLCDRGALTPVQLAAGP